VHKRTHLIYHFLPSHTSVFRLLLFNFSLDFFTIFLQLWCCAANAVMSWPVNATTPFPFSPKPFASSRMKNMPSPHFDEIEPEQ
jgi:hypothetical protein